MNIKKMALLLLLVTVMTTQVTTISLADTNTRSAKASQVEVVTKQKKIKDTQDLTKHKSINQYRYKIKKGTRGIDRVCTFNRPTGQIKSIEHTKSIEHAKLEK